MSKQQIMELISKLYQLTGKFPLIDDLAKRMNVPVYRVSELLKLLVSEGFLERIGNNYRIALQAPAIIPEPPKNQRLKSDTPNVSNLNKDAPRTPVTVGTLVTAIANKLKSDKPKKERDWVLITLRVSMAIIGLVALALSIYYTYVWTVEHNPIWVAFLLAAAISVFSVVAFEIMVVLVKNKQFAIAAFFGILWSIALIYSVFSRVSGQYDAFQAMQSQISHSRKTESVVNAELDSASNIVFDLVKRRVEKSSDKAIQTQAYNSAVIKLAPLDDKKPDDTSLIRQYLYERDVAGNRAIAIQKDIDDIDSKLPEARKSEALAKKSQPVPTAAPGTTSSGVYIWIESATSIPADKVQFWTNVFPALFLDLVAPAALAIALFLVRKKVTKRGLLLRIWIALIRHKSRRPAYNTLRG